MTPPPSRPRRGPWPAWARNTLVGVAFVVMWSGLYAWRAHVIATAPPPRPIVLLPPHVREVRTAHYAIASTATPAQTQQVADAVEALHAAYAHFFALPAPSASAPPLRLVLYRDRDQFRAYNRSKPWAEAYYLRPACYAYYAAGTANPTHWMLHEATHQLNREYAGFPKKAAWLDEGLAAYFGTSKLRGDTLRVGDVDRDAYPIWWLPTLGLSGDFERDRRAGKVIPLRAVISGQGGPDLNLQFNLYYVEYWSLVHFLFHGEGGRYADGMRRLVREGGSVEAFEREIGPIEQVQAQWYAYLRERARAVGNEVVVVGESPAG